MSIDPALLGPLADTPYQFDFFQAVHLLEQLYPERAPVGEFADPEAEVVRFTTPTTVGFPASAIQSFADGAGTAPPELMVNFFGLTGPQGTLPLDYTLYAAGRSRARDHALKDFLGIFEHRMISLFYRAWTKTHASAGFTGTAAVDSEASGATGTRDWLTAQLLSIAGLSTPGLRDRLPVPDETLLYYAGLLGMSSRPAMALEQLIADHFDVACEVEQFVGAWYPLSVQSQTPLGDELASLGGGAVAGDEVWDQQSRVRVRIGPLTRRAYDGFLPGGESYDALRALTRFFGNDQFDFEIQLVLARDEAPVCQLDSDGPPLPLGWGTWLRTAPLNRDPDDARFSL